MSFSFLVSATLPDNKENQREGFAGSEKCASCHKNIYESHVQTAHFLDSRPAAKKFIKGSFLTGENVFDYNKWMHVTMEASNDSFYQSSSVGGVEMQREAFDIVIGSGRKGQSYLFWDADHLFQLPVSYFSGLNTWCNSPGFPVNFISFDRMIPADCLECHSTYAQSSLDENGITTFKKSSIVYGIDCERCHGPAAKHIAFHDASPEIKEAKYISSFSALTRQQRLDACAVCHSGFRDHLREPFAFQTGDTLDQFSSPGYSLDSVSTLDVHGNQYGLLLSSKCFQQSAQMDCSSCHDVHKDEAGKLKVFSQRCITCHQDVEHSKKVIASNETISNNCIDCHMPMMQSSAITLDVNNRDKKVADELRTHRIAIYSSAEKIKK